MLKKGSIANKPAANATTDAAPAPVVTKKAPSVAPKASLARPTRTAEDLKKLAKDNKRYSDHGRMMKGIPEVEVMCEPGKDLQAADVKLSLLWSCIFGGLSGFPRGKLFELYADNHVGKTAQAMQWAGMMQRAGLKVGGVDVEHAFDKSLARRVKMDPDNITMTRPVTGNDAIEDLSQLINVEQCDYIIHDSLAASTPAQRATEDKQMIGDHARLWSNKLPELKSSAGTSGATVILLNQKRQKIGVMFGDPTTTTGGNAPAFYSDMRLSLSKVEVVVDENKSETAYTMRVKVVKNKLTGIKSTYDVRMNPGHIINWPETAVVWAERFGLVDKENKIIAGISFTGRSDSKTLQATIAGKEETVFQMIFAQLVEQRNAFAAGETLVVAAQAEDAYEE